MDTDTVMVLLLQKKECLSFRQTEHFRAAPNTETVNAARMNNVYSTDEFGLTAEGNSCKFRLLLLLRFTVVGRSSFVNNLA